MIKYWRHFIYKHPAYSHLVYWQARPLTFVIFTNYEKVFSKMILMTPCHYSTVILPTDHLLYKHSCSLVILKYTAFILLTHTTDCLDINYTFSSHLAYYLMLHEKLIDFFLQISLEAKSHIILQPFWRLTKLILWHSRF